MASAVSIASDHGLRAGRDSATVNPMQPLRWERRPDGLRAPALVCAFKGWNDAGEAATSALTFMGAGLDATRFALIDPEEFVDFQATRPSVRLVDGLSREIEWPEFEIYEARVPRAPRDLILLSGPEPSMRWRTFCETIDRARRGARRPDGRDARRAARRRAAHAPGLDHRPGLRPGADRAPRPACRRPTRGRPGSSASCTPPAPRPGMPSASLWAAVPHYVAVAPNPKGALALVRRLESLVGVTVDALGARDRRRRLRAPGHAAPSSSTPRCRRSSSASSAPPTRRRPAARATCPRATSSRASSSASCASAGSGGTAARTRSRRRSPRLSALSGRAGDPVVAHRARREAGVGSNPCDGCPRRPRARCR